MLHPKHVCRLISRNIGKSRTNLSIEPSRIRIEGNVVPIELKLDDASIGHPALLQPAGKQRKQRRLATTPYSHEHLHLRSPDERVDNLVVERAWDKRWFHANHQNFRCIERFAQYSRKLSMYRKFCCFGSKSSGLSKALAVSKDSFTRVSHKTPNEFLLTSLYYRSSILFAVLPQSY